MKKVINGALYNTDTAKKLGEWYTEGIGHGDFKYCEEALYQTKSGKYFLYGYGGALTKYAKPVGNNSWNGSEDIQPMSPSAAREWAEIHLDADDYIAIFGEPEEASENREAHTLTFSPKFWNMLEQLKIETGKSISQIIEDKFTE